MGIELSQFTVGHQVDAGNRPKSHQQSREQRADHVPRDPIGSAGLGTRGCVLISRHMVCWSKPNPLSDAGPAILVTPRSFSMLRDLEGCT